MGLLPPKGPGSWRALRKRDYRKRRSLNIDLRSGLHAGEARSSTAVHIAAWVAELAGCGKMQELRHSGARAVPASPETRNTDQKNQWLGLCHGLRARP